MVPGEFILSAPLKKLYTLPMPISWNEIRHNAIRFSKEWAGECREDAEAKSFWDQFFGVFGIRRRTVASFEEPVKKISGDYGFIDLFWPGILIVEHKSRGKDLSKAESQAFRYIQDLARDENRQKEIPRYIIVSDFARVALHDLEPEDQRGLPLFDHRRVASLDFPLAEFHRHIHAFAFIPGYKQHKIEDQDPINLQATEILGDLHDALEFGGYTGHDLERFLVRILFCLFAEDTGIFERESFKLYIENRTAPDGSDLGLHLPRLFDVLNTAPDKRQKNLDESLASFPYVNGELFAENLRFADFDRDMRNALIAATRFDWSRISPAVFGSLFQAVMEPKTRRQIGGHYTSERDILKVIRSLFLDDLRAEFEARKADRSTGRTMRLEEFHDKLCKLRFLDPACGCGNFLVVTYRELRQLELDTLKEIFGAQRELTLDEINRVSQVDVDQFYGIEISEWPVRIAEVALWLMDHQMNLKVSEAFGQLYQRLPLKKSPHIHCGNALRLDWKTVLPPEECSYVLGNPPFVGKTYMTDEQRSDMETLCGDLSAWGLLDYVTAWYFKAAEYIEGSQIIVGFVSTNSITQGEQVGLLWNRLFQQWRLKIHFAHRTFAWASEARGKAHVHVVIIGFAAFDTGNKRIYDYEGVTSTVVLAKNISPYLIEGSDLAVTSRTSPLCEVPEIINGNKQVDGGFLTLTDEEKGEFLRKCPDLKPFVRRFIGSDEFINGRSRWCLWLVNAPPNLIRNNAEILERVEGVREFRLASKKEKTRESAHTPSLFGEIRPFKGNYLAIPEVSSERRPIIPIGFLRPSIIPSNKIQVVPNATLFHFGILCSVMHMAWMRQVTGRMKSDYSYSAKIVYNNFPWPNASVEQRERVEEKAQSVLAARQPHLPPRGLATLADLYDPLTMPRELLHAHAELDRVVEKCYRAEQFHSDRERVEFLFALYEKLTAPLLPSAKSKRARSKTKKDEHESA
jgi:hypothetical protein